MFMAHDDTLKHGLPTVKPWPLICQLLLMLMIACLALFGSLALIAQGDDQKHLEDIRALMRSALQVHKDEVGRNVRDYANWSELYDKGYIHPNREWLAGSVGLNVHENLAIDAHYIVMPDGKIAFGYLDGNPVEAGSNIGLRHGAEQLIAQARAANPMTSEPATGLLRTSDHHALVAAAAITPFGEPALLKPGPPPVLLFVRYISNDLLARIGRDYLIDDLRLVAQDTPEGSTIPLVAVDGSLLGALAWRQDNHGWHIILTAMPVLVAALVLVTGCCFLILRKAFRKGIALLRHHALHDMLTGVPNRTFLQRELERALAHGLPNGQCITLLCLDLDRFKEVNDSWGHDAGDELLRQTVSRLAAVLRGSDTLARTGGDEFAILLGRSSGHAEAQALCQRLLAVMRPPFDVYGHIVHVGLSIGGACAPSDGTTPIQLLKNADIALYKAKAGGRGGFCFFAAQMDGLLQARKQLEQDLRFAIEHKALHLEYQPQVDIETGKITGVEALARWAHPTRGMIPPSEFIPLAEQSGLIDDLGQLVLLEACQQVATWPDISVAVNLSPVQFRRPDLVAMVENVLTTTGLSPERLELEITESSLLDDADEAAAVISSLKRLGVRIAMDDFGTGYSSLCNLQRYPFDRIKIDKSFIARATHDTESEAIVKAVLALGQGLGLAVTAEGVEAPEQVMMLVREGCRSAQGFIYSRPVGSDELATLINTRLGPSRPRLVSQQMYV